MAKFNSRVSVFLIKDSGGTVRNLSTYLTEMSGLPGERELSDASTIGDAGRERFPALQNAMIRIAGFFDDTTTSGPDAVLGGLLVDTTRREMNYGPKGSTTGFARYDCFVFTRRYEITSRVGDLVGFVAEFEIDSVVLKDELAFIT